MAVLLLKVMAGLIVLGVLWFIYYMIAFEGGKWMVSDRVQDYFHKFFLPAIVGVAIFWLKRHLTLALVVSGPLWFFLSVELIDGVEKAERRMAMEKRRIPRYLGQMIISLVLLLIVAIAAFAGKSELQREIAFINLLGGATIGALTGTLMIIGALPGFRFGMLFAFTAGTLGWVIPGFGGTYWFDRVAIQTWPGLFTLQERGLYIAAFLPACILVAAGIAAMVEKQPQ